MSGSPTFPERITGLLVCDVGVSAWRWTHLDGAAVDAQAELLNEQTERVPGRVGHHVQRFALVLRPVVEDFRPRLLRALSMAFQLFHGRHL